MKKAAALASSLGVSLVYLIPDWVIAYGHEMPKMWGIIYPTVRDLGDHHPAPANAPIGLWKSSV
jgi:hypothetical protein